MLRLWFLLRRIRQRATPQSKERGGIEAYLRKNGVFETRSNSTSVWRVCSAVAILVLIVCVSVSSYAYASENVLPDTPLYPVREAIEKVEVKLALTPVQKEKIEQKLEVRRQKEVQKLKELQRPVPVKLKKYMRAVSATTTQRIFEKAETTKQKHARLPWSKGAEMSSSTAVMTPPSSHKIPTRVRELKKESKPSLREERQQKRKNLLEQRRELLEKRAVQHQQERAAARAKFRTQRRVQE